MEFTDVANEIRAFGGEHDLDEIWRELKLDAIDENSMVPTDEENAQNERNNWEV